MTVLGKVQRCCCCQSDCLAQTLACLHDEPWGRKVSRLPGADEFHPAGFCLQAAAATEARVMAEQHQFELADAQREELAAQVGRPSILTLRMSHLCGNLQRLKHLDILGMVGILNQQALAQCATGLMHPTGWAAHCVRWEMCISQPVCLGRQGGAASVSVCLCVCLCA